MRVAIIGAGVAGLVAGYGLTRAGHEVVVFEKEREPGGLIGAFAVADTRLDRYYHHIFRHDGAALGLIEELGLGGEMEWPAASSGYFRDGRVYPLNGALDLLRFRPLRLWERVRFGLSVLRAGRVRDWRGLDGVSARSWLESLCGRRVYRVMWEPLLRSKFGDSYGEVSAAWFWYKLRQRSSGRGRWGSTERLGYLRGSFARLADALADAIVRGGGRVALATPVEGLGWDGAGLRVVTPEGETRWDRVLATVAPPVLLALAPDLPEAYRQRLGAIRYMANVCVVLMLERPLTDIYWLNVSDERVPFGGVIEHTNLLPPEGYGGSHIAYLTRYLNVAHPSYGLSDEALLEAYSPFLREVAPGFDRSWVRGLRVFRAEHAGPVCGRGYGRMVPDVATPVGGLFMANMSQIYPEDRGIDCAVTLARRGVAALLGEPGRPASEALGRGCSAGDDCGLE